MAFQNEPLVARQAGVTAADLQHAKALLRRHDPRRIIGGRPVRVTLRQDELDAALRAGLGRSDRLSGRATIKGGKLTIALTVAVSSSFQALGRYLNLVAGLTSSDRGLAFSRLEIGRLALPGWIGTPALQAAIEAMVGGGRGAEIVDSIRSVSVQNQTASVLIEPPPGAADSVVRAVSQLAKIGDPSAVRIYYRKLAEIARRQGSTVPTSLAAFVEPVFALAAQRSRDRDAAVENRAAVLALAIYFGDPRIERFVGDVRTGDLRARQPRIDHVRLAGRHDLAQHFLVSAGLAIVGGRSLADVVGVDKEFDNIDAAGGFSFADLAADRAGIRFAEGTTASTADAQRLQRRLLAGLKEQDLFPPVDDLPEGLTRARFENRYGANTGGAYGRIVAEIDRRIESLPLYR